MAIEAERGESSIDFGQVAGPNWEYYWPRVGALMALHPVGWSDWITLDWVEQEALAGQLEVWAGVRRGKVEIVALTHVLRFPKKNTINLIWIGGGHLNRYLGLAIEKIELYARAMGCCEAVVCGRFASIKLLEPFGYEQRLVQMRKEL